MDFIQNAIKWVQDNWLVIIGIIVGIDQILKVIAPLTKTKIDDNLADMLGKWLAKTLNKKP